MDRIRYLMIKQNEINQEIDEKHLKIPQHLEVRSTKFKIDNLKKLIKSTTQDLKEADRKRREDFKRYWFKICRNFLTASMALAVLGTWNAGCQSFRIVVSLLGQSLKMTLKYYEILYCDSLWQFMTVHDSLRQYFKLG